MVLVDEPATARFLAELGAALRERDWPPFTLRLPDGLVEAAALGALGDLFLRQGGMLRFPDVCLRSPVKVEGGGEHFVERPPVDLYEGERRRGAQNDAGEAGCELEVEGHRRSPRAQAAPIARRAELPAAAGDGSGTCAAWANMRW